MEKIFSELITWFKEKTLNPFFRYFAFSWIIINYKFIYFLLFVDEEIFFRSKWILKIDLLLEKDFYWCELYSILYFWILPLFSGLLLLYFFPWFDARFYSKYLSNLEKKKEEKHNYNKKAKERELEILSLKLREKKLEWEKYKEELDQEKLFQKEYDEFKTSVNFSSFKDVINIINHGWDLNDISNNFTSYLFDSSIVEDINWNLIFTPKGRYFRKKFLAKLQWKYPYLSKKNKYQNIGKNSGITSYQIWDDFIRVEFASGKYTRYTYSYSSAWVSKVEKMKLLAKEWEWLNSYISKNKPNYISKN